MDLIVERVDVWAAGIEDEAGALAEMLEALGEAGADLDFVLARRSPEKAGAGVVFLTPLRGDVEIEAASDLGFNVTSSVHSVRVEGKNTPGIGAKVTALLADAGLNLRGLSAAVVGPRFIMYIGFDSEEDADEAVSALEGA